MRDDNPFLSIVIPVRDRWNCLEKCLESLTQTHRSVATEVIVIDDGSRERLPFEIRNQAAPSEIKYVRQVPLGIPAARNRGLSFAKGELILFVDSDCRLDAYCLHNLAKAANSYPADAAFQLRIVGDSGTCVGRMENLRLTAVQDSLLTTDGHIRYVNTSAFAIRQSCVDGPELFDISAVRGEDSLVLMKLASSERLPRYVANAIVEHSPQYTPCQYIRKHFWTGYHTGPARRQLHERQGILMSTSQRWAMFRRLQQSTSAGIAPRSSLCLVLLAYGLEVLGRFVYKTCGMKPGRARVLSTFVDPTTEEELQARIVSSAEQRRGMFITYLTGWTLVQSEKNPRLRRLLGSSDLCYADGMGVVLALYCTRLRRVRKVTANSLYHTLFEEISRRKLRVALVGGRERVSQILVSRIRARVPSIDICLCRCGYFSSNEERLLIDELTRTSPHIVFLGMGQPLQEECAYRWRQALPNTTFYCVGGLFDVISGRVTSAPKWVRRCGLEWLSRLVQSPGRLWRRYLVGLPLLCMYIFRDIFLHLPQGLKAAIKRLAIVSPE